MGYLALFRHIRVWKMTAKKQLKLIEVVVIMQSLASSTNQSCLYDLSILIEVRITEFNHQTSASPSLVEERRGKGVIKTHLKDCCPGSLDAETVECWFIRRTNHLFFFNVSWIRKWYQCCPSPQLVQDLGTIHYIMYTEFWRRKSFWFLPACSLSDDQERKNFDPALVEKASWVDLARRLFRPGASLGNLWEPKVLGVLQLGENDSHTTFHPTATGWDLGPETCR